MKRIILFLIVLFTLNVNAQGLVSGKAFEFAKLTTAEKNLLNPDPLKVWYVFDTDNQRLEWYNGTTWVALDTVLTKSQIEVLGIDAGSLTGTLADTRLPSNVALKNTNNNFLTNQNIAGDLRLEKPGRPYLYINQTGSAANFNLSQNDIGFDFSSNTSAAQYRFLFGGNIRHTFTNIGATLTGTITANSFSALSDSYFINKIHLDDVDFPQVNITETTNNILLRLESHGSHLAGTVKTVSNHDLDFGTNDLIRYTITKDGIHNIFGNLNVSGNIKEQYNITLAPTTLSNSQRFINNDIASNLTLTIPTGLSKQVWEIYAQGNQITVTPDTGVTLLIIHNGNSNDGVIDSKHSAKLIQTGTNIYTLIKY